jgi:hypothetical protein
LLDFFKFIGSKAEAFGSFDSNVHVCSQPTFSCVGLQAAKVMSSADRH